MNHRISNILEKLVNYMKKHSIMRHIYHFGDKTWNNVIYEPIILKRCQKNKDNHLVPQNDFFDPRPEDYL